MLLEIEEIEFPLSEDGTPVDTSLATNYPKSGLYIIHENENKILVMVGMDEYTWKVPIPLEVVLEDYRSKIEEKASIDYHRETQNVLNHILARVENLDSLVSMGANQSSSDASMDEVIKLVAVAQKPELFKE